MNNMFIGFDFDQTLAESSTGIFNCLKSVAEMNNLSIEESVLRQLAVSGLTLVDILSQFLPGPDVEFGVELFMRLYPSIGVEGTSLFPGVKELFMTLKKNNVKIFILSSKNHSNLILSLNYLELYADKAIGSLDYKGKVEFIRDLELDFYIGDQISDINAAAEAGCQGILVNNVSEPEISVPLHLKFRSIKEMLQNLPSILEG